MSLTFCLAVLAGCGGDSERARIGDGITATGEETTEPVEEVVVGEGSLFADPGAIRKFADPATEITSSSDLVDYLLPGLTGSGADCLGGQIDADAVLESDAAEGAATVADLILACVAPDEVGKILGMYAVGFEKDGPSRYADLAVCVADGFRDLDPAEVEESLVRVYTERLDLSGPPTSRQAAADEIADRTTCSTAASPPPTPPSETPVEPSEPPRNQRVILWNLLQAGDCLGDLPSGRITQVTVISCRVPHRLEVVGATFSTSADDADSQCANLYANYTGQSLNKSDHRLESLRGEPGSFSARLVCLATASDRSRTTGSIR
jgi:hypothetical protein